MTTFSELGLDPRLAARLDDLGLATPTPIQARAIPHVLAGRDVLGLAQTGTGKTAAFGLPLIDRLLAARRRAAPKSARALVLAPTRELACQIHAALTGFAGSARLEVGLVVGGRSLGAQAQRLARGTDILVATPGRLIDLMDRGAIRLDTVGHLVLDEADQMLDMGFVHALRRIARALPAERQTLLFSATMPRLMDEIAATFLSDPVRVEVSPPGRAVERVAQSVHFVDQGAKADLLRALLAGHRDERALVFGRTKHGAEKLKRKLESWGFAAASIHGNKSQGQRDRALAAFRDGSVKVLVATDVAARGLDIPQVRHVYNFELPNVPANYVHRIGRTARAGADGAAVAFCSEAEMAELRDIEKAMGATIPVAGGRPWAEAKPAGKAKARTSAPSSRARRRGRRGAQGRARSAA